jgi:hypothetical protein
MASYKPQKAYAQHTFLLEIIMKQQLEPDSRKILA